MNWSKHKLCTKEENWKTYLGHKILWSRLQQQSGTASMWQHSPIHYLYHGPLPFLESLKLQHSIWAPKHTSATHSEFSRHQRSNGRLPICKSPGGSHCAVQIAVYGPQRRVYLEENAPHGSGIKNPCRWWSECRHRRRERCIFPSELMHAGRLLYGFISSCVCRLGGRE